jgi:manganese/zinc/iron transport system permease protein
MLAIHLFNHEGTPEEADENRRTGLHEHLRWPPRQVDRVVDWAKNSGLVEPRGELLALTNAGRERARGMLGGR